MSNIFQQVASDAGAVEQSLMGPSYPYWSNIKTPEQIGMSTDGGAIGDDINGLIAYAEVLATGNSAASATGGPLGNKFFLQTGAKCTANDTNESVDRYIYVNNVPSGNIPFISSGLGTDFTDARGLIPGAMSNLNVLNPFAILGAFTSGSNPPCQQITMQTIDTNNNVGTETQYVTTSDIQGMDPCNWGNGGSNPVTGATCSETFTNRNPMKVSDELPKNPLVQLYLAILGFLGIYILYCLMKKAK
jgi:hypothetical protein